MVGATSRGMTLEGLNDMTLGQVVDYFIIWNEMNIPPEEKEKKEQNKTRKATQADWDAFFG